MITFPEEFQAIPKFPGYFWNTKTDTLFSIKVAGVLRELYRAGPSRWTHGYAGYTISHKGKKRFIRSNTLKRLSVANSIMPMEKQYETIRKTNNW